MLGGSQTSAPSHRDDISVEKHELMQSRPVGTVCGQKVIAGITNIQNLL